MPYRGAPWHVPVPARRTPKPAALRVRELGVVAAVVAIADLAFWGRTNSRLTGGGFGAALLFFVAPLLVYLAARYRQRTAKVGVLAALLGIVGLRCAFDPTPGTVLAGFGLLFAFGIATHLRTFFVPETAFAALVAVAQVPSRVGAAFRGIARLFARTRLGSVGRASVLPIAIPAGLVVVFGGIFALANPLVARALGVAVDAIASVVGVPSVPRIFLWSVAALGGVMVLRPALRKARGAEAASATGEATATALLVARNAMFGLNALFLLYNALDATYLWAGSPPPGVPTQKYAHEGAFWLTIALAMLTAVIGVMFRGPLAHDLRAAKTRTLAYVWLGQGLLLALGTYRRIAIHIAHSGLSDLRIVGILGTTLVVSGLLFVGWKLRRERTFTWLVRRQLDAFALTAIVYAVMPTHLLSASVNVARINAGEYRPVLHMFRQAQRTESAAALVPLLDHPDLRVRQGVAALLEGERKSLANDAAAQTSWRERDIATRRTLAGLDEAAPKIDAVLGTVDRVKARRVLLEISRVANEDRSLEELLAIPAADAWGEDGERQSY